MERELVSIFLYQKLKEILIRSKSGKFESFKDKKINKYRCDYAHTFGSHHSNFGNQPNFLSC